MFLGKSLPVWGARGRVFESLRPDHNSPTKQPVERSLAVFVFVLRKTGAKPAQNYPAISLISRSGMASDHATSA